MAHLSVTPALSDRLVAASEAEQALHAASTPEERATAERDRHDACAAVVAYFAVTTTGS